MATHPHHTLAATFPSLEDADDVLHDLARFGTQVHVVAHHGGSYENDEAEVELLTAMERSILVAIPCTILAMIVLMACASVVIDDLPEGSLLAIGIGPGAILGILFGGIAGIMIGEGRLERARVAQRRHAHDESEVVVATVARRALLDPNHRYDAVAPTRDQAALDLELAIQSIFAEHHGRPLVPTP